MLRTLRQLERTDGAEIAEAALVLPLVFMFLLGIVWFGRAFNIYATVTQAAQQGAVTAAHPICAVGCAGVFPTDAVVDNTIFAVLQASSLDPGQIVQPATPAALDCPAPIPNHSCSSTGKVVLCRAVVLNPSTTPAQCGVVVTFQYPFQMNVPFTSLGSQILLTGHAQARMEN
ncbi:MAG TPA: TadE/TadG family type IV pilus assembly protein [Terriglobales bacterium]|nr:TadE/TadG family type IV pilus assembly protein [Terriglobales bacterium]